MRKFAIAFVLLTFVLGGTALGQDPGNPFVNNIGIYLNPAATGSCGAIGEDVPFTVFVILTALTHDEVWGWEAGFTYDNILKLGHTVFGDHVNAGTRPGEFIVGLGSPLLAVNGNVIVAELTLMVNGFYNDVNFPSNVFVSGIYFSLIDPIQGPPAYLEASGSTGVALHQAIGGMGDAQLSMNCDCAPVGVEESSWGNVKSLFR